MKSNPNTVWKFQFIRFIGTGCSLYFTRICLVLTALPKFLKDFLSNLISDLLTNLFPDFLSNLFSDFLTNLFPHLFARVFENPVFIPFGHVFSHRPNEHTHDVNCP